MELKYNEEILDLKYTFNSFKYMEELDLEELSTLDKKPFKMLTITELLLMGALNHNPKVIYDDIVVSEILEEQLENGNLFTLLEYLVGELQESSFFKSLQKTETKKK